MVVTVIDRLLCMIRMAESASQKLNSISEQLHTSGTFFKGEPFTQLSYRQSNQFPSRCFPSSLHLCTVHIESTVRLFQFTYIPSQQCQVSSLVTVYYVSSRLCMLLLLYAKNFTYYRFFRTIYPIQVLFSLPEVLSPVYSTYEHIVVNTKKYFYVNQ